MRTYRRYLTALTLALTTTTVILAAYGRASVDLYLSFYIIEYLAVTLLFADLNPRALRSLNRIAYALFVVFAMIVVMRVIRLLP